MRKYRNKAEEGVCEERGMEMKFGNNLSNILLRLILAVFSCVFVLGIVLVVVYGEPAPGASVWDLVFVVLMLGLFVGLWLHMLTETAPGELTKEGVYIRPFLIRRFYPWASIRQAGVLWRMGRGVCYNELVLLKPGGSLRRYRDWSFSLRNGFHLIRLGDNPAIRDYVIRHYGPLDFDLSDGRPEKSIVAD